MRPCGVAAAVATLSHPRGPSCEARGSTQPGLHIKGEIYRNDLHETLVSAGLALGVGHSGAQGAGANTPDLVAPGIFFGKGCPIGARAQLLLFLDEIIPSLFGKPLLSIDRTGRLSVHLGHSGACSMRL